jgi:hypothetical protein
MFFVLNVRALMRRALSDRNFVVRLTSAYAMGEKDSYAIPGLASIGVSFGCHLQRRLAIQTGRSVKREALDCEYWKRHISKSILTTPDRL